MAVVTMRQLLESGVHFGHQTRRWNPKMKRFIMTERNGIYIIDLQQSLTYIDNAYEFVKETVAHGGTILFVGTKKQAQEPIAEQATRVGMPYVNQRWLGGMLTNFQTVHKRLSASRSSRRSTSTTWPARGLHEEGAPHPQAREGQAREDPRRHPRHGRRSPRAVWIVDTKKEHLAVDEARKLGIPVIAILDTNCDPDEVDYKIPGNDDAIRSVTLLTRVIADAVAEGLIARSARQAGAGRGEPSPPTSRSPSGSASSSPAAEAAAEAAGPPRLLPPRPAEAAAADAAEARRRGRPAAEAPAAEAAPRRCRGRRARPRPPRPPRPSADAEQA